MAIKNASDLLVYKKSPANVAQVTRVKVLNSTPLVSLGTLKILNTTNSGGANVAELTTSAVAANTSDNVLAIIGNKLGASGYTSGVIIPDGDDYKYRDFTNTFAGDVNTFSVVDGTGEIEDGAIEVIVINSGETLDGQEPIAHSTSASISFNEDLRDVTSKDSGGYQENAGGLRSFELSADALQDINADLDFKEFYDDINERNEVIVRFAERDTGGSDVKWEGSGYISSLSMDAGVEENVTYSVTITGTGVVTKGTD
jgi:predicted secreted protein